MDTAEDAEASKETVEVPQVVESTPAAASDAEVSGAAQESENESTKAESNVAGETEQDQEEKSNPGSDWETEEDASDAESGSSLDSDAESIAPPDVMQRLKRDCAKHFTSETFFDAYTQRLKGRARRGKNQGSTLVKGLVDYMRTLEERISSLEENQDAESEASTDSDDVAKVDIHDSQVTLDVKFFNAEAYIEFDGTYTPAYFSEEKGTFSK
jgi:hypothetical protein